MRAMVPRFAACLALASLAAAPALAQTLGPRLQDAKIVGHGSTITITRLPVRTPEGIVYRDITIQLKVDATGDVGVRAQGNSPAPSAPTAQLQSRVSPPPGTQDVTVGSITETPTAPEVEAHFIAGTYRGPDGALVQVMRTGRPLTGGQFPTWALTALGESPITSAAWYAGPLRTNPHQALINRAHINSNDYSYGIIDASGPEHFD